MTGSDLEELRGVVRQACEEFGGPAAVRALKARGPEHPGYDERAWDLLARQIGLAGLGLPEDVGGLGGVAELLVVCEELGAALLPVPFLSSTVLAGQVLTSCGSAAPSADNAASKSCALLAEGAVFALAAVGAEGTWRPGEAPFAARAAPSGWLLDGEARFVLDGLAAAHLVVVAHGPDGREVFEVDAADPGVSRSAMTTLDLSRAQASVRLRGAAGVRLTEAGRGDDVLAGALDVAWLALAAEQLGGAQRCLDRTLAQVKERRQFGRVIGSFQAVKHRLVDLLVHVEYCRSALGRGVEAAALVAQGAVGARSALAEAAAVAQTWCSEAFVEVAAETVQLHGGMGFTWEHDAHLYFRRAQADAVLLGGVAWHRERLATLKGW